MPAPFTAADIQASLRNASDPKAQAFANDMEVVNGVWRILNVSLELMADTVRGGGKMTTGGVGGFAVKKTLAVAELAGGNSEGVKVATFVGGTFVSTLGGGLEAMAMTPGKAGVFITLKVAEKVVSAAGMGQVDKCKAALAALTVSAGLNVFTCVATGGALCILGATAFALEAINTHAQCNLPPTGAI